MKPHEYGIKKFLSKHEGYETKQFREKSLKAITINMCRGGKNEREKCIDWDNTMDDEVFYESYCKSCIRESIEEYKEYLPKTIPDAFKIELDKREINVVEIEDSSCVDEVKISKYMCAWFYLDCEGWDLRLFVANRWGNNIDEISLIDIYFHEQKKHYPKHKIKRKT